MQSNKDKNDNHEHGGAKPFSITARMELPKHNNLDRKCKWVCPEFSAVSGIGPGELWTLRGMIGAIGYFDENKQNTIGSGVMIAPGLCLTATHVLEGLENRPFLFSFVDQTTMRIWIVEDFHAQKFQMELVPFQSQKPKFSDVCVLSCSPFSVFSDNEPFYYPHIEASIPKIGERLWTVGYREQSNDGAPLVDCFTSSGLVTEVYMNGRGTFMKGPCVEVAMNVVGGMSGGPVFNAAGKIVGIISSGFDGGTDAFGPSYVSLVWPALLSKVHAPWPENHWPDQTAGLQIETKAGGAQVHGSARWGDGGAIHVTFLKQTDESMMKLLRQSGFVPDSEAELPDISYELFEEYLETEGVRYLETLQKGELGEVIEAIVPAEIGSVLECKEVDCFEGMEDLDVTSITQLEDGNLGVEATFNLRRVALSVSILKENDEWMRTRIEGTQYFYDRKADADEVIYRTCIRPYFRVTFTLNTKQQCCDNLHVLAASLPEERRRKMSRNVQQLD